MTASHPPTSLTAGDSFAFIVDAPSADVRTSLGWGAAYYLVGPSTEQFPGTPVGDDRWEITGAATATAALTPGRYRASVVYTAGSSLRVTTTLGWVTVAPDPLQVGPNSSETFAQRALRIIEHYIETGALPSGVQGYMVGDRQVQNVPLRDLMRERARLRAEVNAEMRGSEYAAIPVRFVR